MRLRTSQTLPGGTVNIFIGESDAAQAAALQKLVTKVSTEAMTFRVFPRIKNMERCLRAGQTPDLLLLNQELADKENFERFKGDFQDLPVIFFSESARHVLHAFRFNTIGYILKPYQQGLVKEALEKFKRIWFQKRSGWRDGFHTAPAPVISLNGYRQRFIIKTGNKIQFRNTKDVAFFFAEGKSVYLVARNDSSRFIIDHTLEELERCLDPDQFFRISRKHIVCVDCISEVRGTISGKLGIRIRHAADPPLAVSRERVHDFKRWLDQ